jgi:hypothetical protein
MSEFNIAELLTPDVWIMRMRWHAVSFYLINSPTQTKKSPIKLIDGHALTAIAASW